MYDDSRVGMGPGCHDEDWERLLHKTVGVSMDEWRDRLLAFEYLASKFLNDCPGLLPIRYAVRAEFLGDVEEVLEKDMSPL